MSVSLAVKRGDQTLERQSVLADGEEPAHQSFECRAMAAEDNVIAEHAVYRSTLSYNSDGCDAVYRSSRTTLPEASGARGPF